MICRRPHSRRVLEHDTVLITPGPKTCPPPLAQGPTWVGAGVDVHASGLTLGAKTWTWVLWARTAAARWNQAGISWKSNRRTLLGVGAAGGAAGRGAATDDKRSAWRGSPRRPQRQSQRPASGARGRRCRPPTPTPPCRSPLQASESSSSLRRTRPLLCVGCDCASLPALQPSAHEPQTWGAGPDGTSTLGSSVCPARSSDHTCLSLTR